MPELVLYREIIFYVFVGYLFGSVLFAKVFGRLFGRDVITLSADGNPGTANAFMYGGPACGLCTLAGDVLKGFLPVFLFLRAVGAENGGPWLAAVMAAPVLGHAFPALHGFHGGKGIATAFGVLLGLAPDMLPVAILAAAFLFFSLILRISPHYYRTFVSFAAALGFMANMVPDAGVILGFAAIFVTVTIKLASSREEREKFAVRLLWKH